VITIATTRVPENAYPRDRVLPGAMARMMTADWHEMTAAANASPNHVSSSERWFKLAKETNQSLDDEQAARLGEMLKTEHYRKMGRLSAEARKLARQAAAILADIDAAEQGAA
jgi:hypothetical protein